MDAIPPGLTPAEETFTLTARAPGGINATFDVVGDKGDSFGTINGGQTLTLTSSSGAYSVRMTVSESSAAPNDYAGGDTFVFTWTKTPAIFSVLSSVAGLYPEAEVGKVYSQDAITFIIRQGTTPFAVGDTFTFTITSIWNVSGTVSGPQTNTATTGALYASDNFEVSFTIWQGTVDYAIGDKFTFTTTAGLTYWTVVGSVSGTQSKLAFASNASIPVPPNPTENQYVQGYYSDGREIYFEIYEGTVPFGVGAIFTFSVTANPLNHGWTVWDMVRVPDTHGATAILYAGTAAGVYKTINGAQTWSSLTYFTGDYVIALKLYPTATGGSSDIIYAGTQNAGVWASTDSGTTWTQYVTGIDSGYGATIKDLLVDPANHRLYAIAYTGPVASATGNVYMHTLNSDGTMTADPWVKTNTGLPGTALYALGSDIPSSPSALFVGGEGINLHKATSGLDTGTPSWAASKSGISNLIMARMPVLFSGECFMSIYRTDYGNGKSYFEVYIEDKNGNPPLDGSTFEAKPILLPGVLWPDDPIWDVTYSDIYKTPHGSDVHGIFRIHGTFRDPSNGTTNDPYWLPRDINLPLDADKYESVKFTFTPKCATDAPGCSGTEQVVYEYLHKPGAQ